MLILYRSSFSNNQPVFRGADKTHHEFDDLVPGVEYAIIFQVLRIGGNNDPEQLLLQRTCE